jgi:hypothetical protein
MLGPIHIKPSSIFIAHDRHDVKIKVPYGLAEVRIFS